jgi:hypothetical protein
MSRCGRGVILPLVLAGLTLTGRAAAVAPDVNDVGKFFSAEAVKKANEQLREIYSKYDLDLLIETWATVPPADIEKVKGMSDREKAEYFTEWAQKRAKYRVVNGIYVMVCKSPTRLQVELTTRARRFDFDNEARDRLAKLLTNEFRDRRFDEGMMEAIRFVRERLAKASPR